MTSQIARNQTNKPNDIGQNFVMYTVTVSLILAILATSYQLYAEYKRDLIEINNAFGLIKDGYLPAISKAMQQDDAEQLNILFAGVLSFPHILSVVVQENDKFPRKSEQPVAGSILENSYPLYIFDNGVDRKFGKLVVRADLSAVYQKNWERFWLILFLNAAIVFALTLPISLMMNRFVRRPLREMTEYTTSLNLVNDRLTEQFQDLAESELFFRRFFEGSDLGLYVTEIDGTICRVNASLCNMMNRGEPEILGKKITCLMDVIGLEEMTFLQNLEKGVHIQVKEEREFSYLDQMGTQKYVSISRDGMTDKDGCICTYLFILRDMTERKITEERIKTLQRLDVLGSLTRELTHDFNNILAIIQANVGIIELKKNDPDVVLKRLNIIKDTISSSAKTMQSLQPVTDQKPLDEKIVSLYEFSRNLEDVLRASVDADIELNVTFHGEDLQVSVDQHQLHNALVDVVSNAQNSILGAGVIVIDVSSKHFGNYFSNRYGMMSAGDYIEISVTDNGQGLPEQNLSKLLDPFFSINFSGKERGLGLSLVHGFATKSGGLIDVKNSLGQGTKVTLYLPYNKDKNQDISRSVPSSSDSYRSAKILISENNEEFTSSIKRNVSRCGFLTKTDLLTFNSDNQNVNNDKQAEYHHE